jgi:hypothetical protein
MTDKERRLCNHVVRAAERRGEFRDLVGTPEEKRSLGRHKRRWEDNIKVDFQEMGWGNGLD